MLRGERCTHEHLAVCGVLKDNLGKDNLTAQTPAAPVHPSSLHEVFLGICMLVGSSVLKVSCNVIFFWSVCFYHPYRNFGVAEVLLAILSHFSSSVVSIKVIKEPFLW